MLNAKKRKVNKQLWSAEITRSQWVTPTLSRLKGSEAESSPVANSDATSGFGS